MYKLVICDDEGKTTVVPLIRDKITIGRKAGNTIRLTDRNVSRHHAALKRSDNVFLIEDLGSLAGTKVRGDLLRSETVEIAPNDQIMIGDYLVSIRTNVSAEVPLGRQIDAHDNSSIGKVTPHSRLVVIRGPQIGREIDLIADLYVVGRSDEANCRIPDPSISRAHARIDREGNHWTISDLDSNAGIEINGFKKDDYVLKAGDMISLGNVELRFVAPGEPFEYNAPEKTSPPPIPNKIAEPPKSPSLLLIIGFIVSLCVLGIMATLVLRNSNAQSSGFDSDPAFVNDDQLSFEQLMETGKDKIQTEEWGEAARLFALALQESPGNVGAQDMKRLAISESDSQNAFAKSLAAFEQKDWVVALNHVNAIPRSSHYYDEQQIRLTVKKLCQQLISLGRDAIRSENSSELEEILKQLDELPEPAGKCSKSRDALHLEHQKLLRSINDPQPVRAVQSGNAPKRAPNTNFLKQDQNPYSNETNIKPEPAKAAATDPISKARDALKRKDAKSAIAILEKAGNQRNVLALLANLYKQNGNKAGYDRIANRFVRLYPADPKTPQFRKNLRR